MQTISHSPIFLKKRKFLLVLPLLVLPFIIFLFYILGGGKGNINQEPTKTTGLNLQLPDAHFKKKKEADKLGLYEAAGEDSAKWKAAVKNDPYRMDTEKVESMSFEHSQALKDILDKTAADFPEKSFEKLNGSLSSHGSVNRENEIKDKLSKLQAIVSSKPAKQAQDPEFSNTVTSNPAMEGISGLIKGMKNSSQADPELTQLDKMLDKVMAIQHPEVKTDSVGHVPNQSLSVYTVEAAGGENAVTAIIPEKQTLVSGATIRLQLTEPVTIAGMQISSDQFLYGTAMLSNERLKIQIRSIRAGNNILPVSVDIYDLDGMEGIYVPGSISRDVSKQSLDQGMSGLGLTALDPSIGAQVASAGIQTAKTLISRKVKLIQVSIPGGYQVLLKNAH
jgi:conjugative transposon TraM protein